MSCENEFRTLVQVVIAQQNQVGDRGRNARADDPETIRALQTVLMNTRHGLNITLNGVMDDATRNAISEIQREGRAPVTGVVDTRTLGLLATATNNDAVLRENGVGVAAATPAPATPQAATPASGAVMRDPLREPSAAGTVTPAAAAPAAAATAVSASLDRLRNTINTQRNALGDGRNDSPDDIRALQEALRATGFGASSVTVNGQMDNATRAAIRALQTSSGLRADGIVGSQTLRALESHVRIAEIEASQRSPQPAAPGTPAGQAAAATAATPQAATPAAPAAPAATGNNEGPEWVPLREGNRPNGRTFDVVTQDGRTVPVMVRARVGADSGPGASVGDLRVPPNYVPAHPGNREAIARAVGQAGVNNGWIAGQSQFFRGGVEAAPESRGPAQPMLAPANDPQGRTFMTDSRGRLIQQPGGWQLSRADSVATESPFLDPNGMVAARASTATRDDTQLNPQTGVQQVGASDQTIALPWDALIATAIGADGVIHVANTSVPAQNAGMGQGAQAASPAQGQGAQAGPGRNGRGGRAGQGGRGDQQAAGRAASNLPGIAGQGGVAGIGSGRPGEGVASVPGMAGLGRAASDAASAVQAQLIAAGVTGLAGVGVSELSALTAAAVRMQAAPGAGPAVDGGGGGVGSPGAPGGSGSSGGSSGGPGAR